MERLDLAIRTLFQEFQESVLKRDQLQASLKREKTFVKKKIKGNNYWYLQQYKNGKSVQSYLGPTTAQLEKEILEKRKERQQSSAKLKQILRNEQRRGAMLRRGGLPSLDATTAPILELFSRMHLIYQKGVLIGSYAFSVYSGLLGKLFEEPSLKTQDIDIVRDRNIEIGFEDIVSFKTIFKEHRLDFRPIPTLSHNELPYSFIGPEGLRIDLLTPLRGRPRGSLQVPGIQGASAQALRFLDYLIEEPLHSVLLGPKGGIPITVPQPARFAIHKLIVSHYRPTTELAKRKKDLLQARQLIEALQEEQPEELNRARKLAMKQGKKWKAAVEKGWRCLAEHST